MQYKNKKILLYLDDFLSYKELSNEELGELFRGVLDYYTTKNYDINNRVIQFMFDRIKNNLDDLEVKYNTVCEKRRKAGSLGGFKKAENLNSLNTAENLEENQVENQDSIQDDCLANASKCYQMLASVSNNNNNNNNNNQENNNYIYPTSNSGFGCKTITENAEQEESIVIQDSIFTQDNNTPLENNNTVNARQENKYNGKESKSSDISREKAIVNWNRIASNYGLCEIRTITDTRFTKLKSRVKQAGGWQEFWNIVNEAIQESKFLRGEKGWKADFDFCLQPSSFVKLMEKTYK